MPNTTFALAFALLAPRVGPDEALSALKLAEVVCNVLDPLSNDEIKRTAVPDLAEKIGRDRLRFGRMSSPDDALSGFRY